MLKALDSATPPNVSQVAQAKSAGVRMWNGYLTTKPNVGIFHPWSQSDFNTVRVLGKPIAYCSGNDDPAACKAQAAAWNVFLCLDVESGIRGDGPWVQGWLNASGAGLYGNQPVHNGRNAAFHVLADYPGYDPNATWASTGRPPGPCGWQWQGTHTEFGMGVDSSWFDDWFGTATQGDEMILFGVTNPTGGPMPVFLSNGQTYWHVQNEGQLNDVKYLWNPTVNAPDDNGFPTPVQDPGAFGFPLTEETATASGQPWPWSGIGGGSTTPTPLNVTLTGTATPS